AGAICSQLRREGFDAVPAGDGLAGLGLFRERSPELVILDLMLPLLNGLDLCRIIRGESRVPIILTAKKATEAELELVTRVRAHLRRAGISEPETESGNLVVGPIQMDTERHEVYARGESVDMTRKEFALLETLILRPGKLVTGTILLSEVWGIEYVGDGRTLDAHIRRVRSKIEEDPGRPRYVKTVRGLGYKLQP
ncbi:MAG: two-component system, OmpR family, response regulator RegX3, partial [Actinomycetota bacterium]|nr:two-component system, OmpR family, response regulator RegX3 [Actinomycetota bacterium]